MDLKNKKIYKRDDCRVCGSKELVEILNLGSMPPANSFAREEMAGDEKYPLVVYFCPKCKLAQLLHVVNPEILFKNYAYFTSASRPLAEHFEKLADSLADRFSESKNDLAVEIGGNDGILLARIKNKMKVLNIEPAITAAKVARERGVETLTDFFNSKLAGKILKNYGPAKIVVANNVLAHIDNITGVFAGIKKILADDGVFAFEVHWIGNLIGDGGFDQIYHEHLCYYSLIALNNLMKRSGLNIFDVVLMPIHGESMRIYSAKNRKQSKRVKEFLNKEVNLGLDKAETFLMFSKKVGENKKALTGLLADLKKEGRSIAGYGAPAKGNTLLNYCGIGTNTLDFITDTTPAKQGCVAPGSRIPVFAPEKIKEQRPDYLLLLAWNYADAIIKKESEYRKNGGKFIIPVPEPRIV